MKILYIEDDLDYQKIIEDILVSGGHHVEVASNYTQGIEFIAKRDYELVITDLNLGNKNGLDIIRYIKNNLINTKTLILTGINDDLKEFSGLSLGVDDYLKKPITSAILLKKIDNLDRASNYRVDRKIYSAAENIVIDIETRKVYKDNVPIELTYLEFDLLAYLLKNRNKKLSREELYEQVWSGNSQIGDLRTIDIHINRLRTKLRISSIYSIRGIGYEWFEISDEEWCRT